VERDAPLVRGDRPGLPADASPEIAARLSEITLACARIFGLAGYARSTSG